MLINQEESSLKLLITSIFILYSWIMVFPLAIYVLIYVAKDIAIELE